MEFFSAPYVEQHHVRSACGQTTLAAKLALSCSELAETAVGWGILWDGDEEDAKDLHC